MNIEYAKEIFKNMASQYDNYGDIKEQIRNLHSYDDLDDEQYDYILENWDNLLIEFNL